MEPGGQFPGADAPPTLAELIVSLEHSSLMAKQLLTATDPSHLQRIHNSLTTAHHHLSSFLSLPFQNPQPDEKSNSSAINVNAEPMQVGEEEEEEEEMRNSESGAMMMMMEEVEEKMRGFLIRNKRAKRSLSPLAAAAAEQKRLHQDGIVESKRFDPNGTRLRNLDLIYQFHS